MALEEEDSEDDQGPVGLRQLFEMSLPEVELRQSFCVRPLGRRHRQRPDAQQGSADDDDDQEENLDEVEICDAKGNTSATEAENDDVVLDAQELDIRVLCAEMDQGSSWQSGKFLWPAARALCEYLGSDEFAFASHAREDRITRVMELGAGAGLVGIFLARLQARLHRRRGYVVLTDRDPFLLDMIQRNAAKNATDGPLLPVETAELSWGADDPSLDAFRRKYSRRPFDLIVGADLLYSTEVVALVFETVDQVFRHAEGRGVFGQFVLCSSFRVQETSDLICGHCRRLDLEREVLRDEIANGGVIVERFVRAASAMGYVQTDHSLSHALRDLKRDEYGLYARIQSIHADANFVERTCSQTFGAALPVFANLRNGAWYTRVDGCYFKSTDGHVADPTFAARRLNTNVLRAACNAKSEGASALGFLPSEYRGGAILVDATRRGKRFPDAFTRTVPIWCFVLNRVAGHDSAVLDLPPWVSDSERSALETRYEEWMALVPAPAREVIHALLAERPPLRPVWVCCDTKQDWNEDARCTELTLSLVDPEAPCTPIICLSASVAIDAETERIFRRSWRYIPGAGDDHEMWAGLLSPELFWSHRQTLVECQSNEECEQVLEHIASGVLASDGVERGNLDATEFASSVPVEGAQTMLVPVVLAVDDNFVSELDAKRHVLIDLRGSEQSELDGKWESALPAPQTLVLRASAKDFAQRPFWQTRCLLPACSLLLSARSNNLTCVVRAAPMTTERATLATALSCMGVVSGTEDIKAEVNASLFRVMEAAGKRLPQPPARKLLKNVIVFLHDQRRMQGTAL